VSQTTEHTEQSELGQPIERRVRIEPNQRWIRVFFGGEAVADSIATLYLFEKDHLPVYYFPRSDVRLDLMEPTTHTTHCPYKGDASYFSIHADGRDAENAVWTYEQPFPGVAQIGGYLAFYPKKVEITVDK
jgi:uncharacterized protein (DUF427 family)